MAGAYAEHAGVNAWFADIVNGFMLAARCRRVARGTPQQTGSSADAAHLAGTRSEGAGAHVRRPELRRDEQAKGGHHHDDEGEPSKALEER